MQLNKEGTLIIINHAKETNKPQVLYDTTTARQTFSEIRISLWGFCFAYCAYP